MEQAQPHRAVLRVGETEVHWAEAGNGPPLVLLHGLADSHRTWEPVLATLSKTRRVLMPDLAGHGLSSRPDASYSVAWHADVVAKWMAALGLEEVDLVGHSYGGGVCQWLMLLAERPKIRRLALVSAGGLGRDVAVALRLAAFAPFFERFGQPVMGPGTRLFLRLLASPFDQNEIDQLSWMNAMPGTAAAFARTVRDVIDWRGQRRGFWDRAHDVPQLPPTAVYWGDRDPIIPIHHGRALSRQVEGVSLTCFAGCGHYPHREYPEAFCRALEAFLDDEAIEPARIRRTLSAFPVQRSWPRFAQALALRGIANRLRASLTDGRVRPRLTLRRAFDVRPARERQAA